MDFDDIFFILAAFLAGYQVANKRFRAVLTAICIVLAVVGVFVHLTHESAALAPQPSVLAQAKDPTPPNPNRPYYDQWGNQFDYRGNLLVAARCFTDPVTHEANPISCPVAEVTGK